MTTRKKLPHPASSDLIYADDEMEFLLAVAAYKAANRRPFPSLRELLAVLKGLGYRKGAADDRTGIPVE